MKVPAELVGGDYDGLELEAAEGAPDLIVPSAYWNDADGVVTGVSVMIYEDMGRCSAGGRRLYRFVREASEALPRS